MLRLDFTCEQLHLPEVRATTRRSSVSGVQDKVQLKRVRGGYDIVASGGDYILKPVPSHTSARWPDDIPANEALTMDIAHAVFGIRTAEHALVSLADGSPAYLTKRFDRREGKAVRQEDFCQLSGRSTETHGSNYKYDASYEELAELVQKYCPAARVENPKVFFLILFNYALSNGDAHLKNFSLFESPQGDYILTPAYDLLNTALHFPSEPSATGLDFFADGHYTSRYEELGFYSSADFIELGKCFGVARDEVASMIGRIVDAEARVTVLIEASALSQAARADYIARFRDRVKALRQ